VHIAAPSKKKLQFVVHDFVEGYDTYTEKPGYTWPADLAFREVDPAEYAALVIPGGRAPEYIRNDPDRQRIIRHFFERAKPVAWSRMPATGAREPGPCGSVRNRHARHARCGRRAARGFAARTSPRRCCGDHDDGEPPLRVQLEEDTEDRPTRFRIEVDGGVSPEDETPLRDR